MKKRFGILAGLVMVLILGACEYETIVPKQVVLPDEPVKFSTQIAPMFDEAGCTACHAGATNPDLRPDKAYESLVNGGYLNIAVPDDSKLIKKINSNHGTASNLSAEQKALLLKWIKEGAKNN